MSIFHDVYPHLSRVVIPVGNWFVAIVIALVTSRINPQIGDFLTRLILVLLIFRNH